MKKGLIIKYIMSVLKSKRSKTMHQPTNEKKPEIKEASMAKIIKLSNGEEIACIIAEKQPDEKSPLIRIENPLLVKYVPRIDELGIADYIALVKWVGFTNDKVVSIPKDKILTICNATAPFTKRYKKILANSESWEQKLPEYLNRNMSKRELEANQREFEDRLDTLKDLIDMPSKKLH